MNYLVLGDQTWSPCIQTMCSISLNYLPGQILIFNEREVTYNSAVTVLSHKYTKEVLDSLVYLYGFVTRPVIIQKHLQTLSLEWPVKVVADHCSSFFFLKTLMFTDHRKKLHETRLIKWNKQKMIKHSRPKSVKETWLVKYRSSKCEFCVCPWFQKKPL